MAHLINWHPEQTIEGLAHEGMEVLEECCQLVVEEMKVSLVAAIRGNNGRWIEHGPYKSGDYEGKSWTARYKGEMVKSIRLVKRKDSKSRNIWIMAGHYNAWWAVQMEFGHGQWKGGAMPFFRVGIKKAMPKIASLMAARNAVKKAA